jgi:hypothetical protein
MATAIKSGPAIQALDQKVDLSTETAVLSNQPRKLAVPANLGQVRTLYNHMELVTLANVWREGT